MLDLDDIKRRLALPDRWGDDGDDPWSEDMPLLVAEVERLRAENERLRTEVSRCVAGMGDPCDFAAKEAWAEELRALIAR